MNLETILFTIHHPFVNKTAKGDLCLVPASVASEFNLFVWLLFQTTQQDFSRLWTHSNHRTLQSGRRATNVFRPIPRHERFDNVDVKTFPVPQKKEGGVTFRRNVFPFDNLVDHAIDTVEIKFPIVPRFSSGRHETQLVLVHRARDRRRL
jgi:hypothetical protein